ncbi:XRE family transcriptional regulator [Ancylobacter sp. VNQ12]|uniref:XRE family transcriptional regulator n=1 Tax=Ancylobacter sp. VNQ12 TaxID=3400920 RepID=UPI003C0429C6
MVACEHQNSDIVNQNIDGDRLVSVRHIAGMTGKVVNKPLGQRVKAAREGAGLTQAQLAESTGVKQSAIAEIEGGRVRRPKGLHEISIITGRSMEWLLGKEDEHIPSEHILADGNREPDHPVDVAGNTARRRERRELGPGELLELDVNGSAGPGAMGETIMVDGREIDSVRATWRMPEAFIHNELRSTEADIDILAVDGDSMIPTLMPGDRVLINRRQNSPATDGLYAIGSMYGVQIKRLELVPGRNDPPKLRVISDNQAHRSYEVTVEEIHIVGRVICRISRM